MKTEAFGKALLPRPQSTVRYHSTNGHEQQVGLIEDTVQSRARAKSTNARLTKSDVNELMGPLVVEAHHQLQIQGRMCK